MFPERQTGPDEVHIGRDILTNPDIIGTLSNEELKEALLYFKDIFFEPWEGKKQVVHGFFEYKPSEPSQRSQRSDPELIARIRRVSELRKLHSDFFNIVLPKLSKAQLEGVLGIDTLSDLRRLGTGVRFINNIIDVMLNWFPLPDVPDDDSYFSLFSLWDPHLKFFSDAVRFSEQQRKAFVEIVLKKFFSIASVIVDVSERKSLTKQLLNKLKEYGLLRLLTVEQLKSLAISIYDDLDYVEYLPYLSPEVVNKFVKPEDFMSPEQPNDEADVSALEQYQDALERSTKLMSCLPEFSGYHLRAIGFTGFKVINKKRRRRHEEMGTTPLNLNYHPKAVKINENLTLKQIVELVGLEELFTSEFERISPQCSNLPEISFPTIHRLEKAQDFLRKSLTENNFKFQFSYVLRRPKIAYLLPYVKHSILETFFNQSDENSDFYHLVSVIIPLLQFFNIKQFKALVHSENMSRCPEAIELLTQQSEYLTEEQLRYFENYTGTGEA